MKKVISLSLISLLALGLASCKPDKPIFPDKEPGTGTTPPTEFYITFKADGATVTETEASGTRGLTATPRTLIISGTATSGAAPKFKFFTEESFIGFEKGLNVGCNTLAYPSNTVEYTNSAGVLYSTQTDDDGVHLFLSDISYTNGGVATGTFNGTVKNAAGALVHITEGKFNVKFGN